ncbi:MAG: response regulator transcription factor, partial [Arenicellales bacterium]|nr:response regulator transcription factor [Arenicellales bacterium]
MKVLIVDDHALFRVGLQGLLERRGIEIAAVAGEGEEGVRLASELRPEVILLDLRMPETGGL